MLGTGTDFQEEEAGRALVGRQVRKFFPGYDWYEGVVEDYNAAENWCAPACKLCSVIAGPELDVSSVWQVYG